MISAGWPSAHEMFTMLPPPSRFSQRPSSRRKPSTFARSSFARRRACESHDVDLRREVPSVREQHVALQQRKMLGAQRVAHARDRQHDVREPAGLGERQTRTVHQGVRRLDRIHLADDDVCAEPLGSQRAALAAPAVADDHDGLAGEHEVRRPHDAFPDRLPRAVHVVEEILAARVVDEHDRETQLTSFARARARSTPDVVSSQAPSISPA